MANEKIKILKLLEEGKITAEEAAKLLGAAGKTASSGTRDTTAAGNRQPGGYPPDNTNRPASAPPHQSPTGGGGYTSARPYASGGGYGQGNDTRRPASGGGSGMEQFAGEMSRKVESFVKDFEPTLQKWSEIVTEKTAQAADKISKSLATPAAPPRTGTGNPGGTPARPYPSGGFGRGYEKEIALAVAPGRNELVLAGLNAPVLLKGYNGDKISAKLFCVPKRPDARIELSVLGTKYFLDYDEEAFEKVAIDAFIPERLFQSLSLSVYNGDMNLSTLHVGSVNIYATNSAVTLNQITAETVKVECENGKEMRLAGLYADNALIENYNGGVAAEAVDVANLKIASFNGAFHMHITRFDRYKNYVWVLETSNQKLNLNLPTLPDTGYYLRARSSLGTVRIALTGLNYLANSPTAVEAKSIAFDTLPKKVSLSLETSNAPLVVN